MTLRLGDLIWFKLLKKNEEYPNSTYLLEKYTINSFTGDLVIRQDRNYKGNKSIYFAYFGNYLEFATEFLTYNQSARCFHEVFIPNKRVKLFFDIETDEVNFTEFNQKEFFNDTILNLIILFDSLEIKLDLSRDIFWLESNKQDKISYHLIIDNYSFSSMREVRYLALKLADRLRYPQFFDFGVYAENKSLRTCHSNKFGEKRIFSPLLSWNYKDKEIDYIYRSENKDKIILDFQTSLVTNTGHCKFINFILETAPIVTRIEINDKVDEIISNYIDSLDFAKFCRREGNKILLTRTRASNCEICNKTHENQNPVINIIRKKNEFIKVYYNCRRNSKSLTIYEEGEIDRNKDDINDESGIYFDAGEVDLSFNFGDLEKLILNPENRGVKKNVVVEKIKLDLIPGERKLNKINILEKIKL